VDGHDTRVPKDDVVVVVDSREGWSAVPSALRSLGVEVATRRLFVGDYVVGDEILVERKGVRDLHRSVIEGRLWRQLGWVRSHSRRAYLLIEGPDLDDGPLNPAAVRGVCVAAADGGAAVLRSSSPGDSALWLQRLAVRWQSRRVVASRPVYDQAPAARPGDISEAVLAAVPGISVTVARALLERFESVAGVVAAGPEKWLETPGVGSRRSATLERAFLGARASRRNGEKLEEKRPVAQHTFETSQPGGTGVACSSQAEPRHPGGDP